MADLQYRDVGELAVGHGVATTADTSAGACHRVCTCWIPRVEVERVQPADLRDLELRMETLSAVADAASARSLLNPLAGQYRTWIATQRRDAPAEPRRREVHAELLSRAEQAAARIWQGTETLAIPQALEAFRLANQAMAMAARRRRPDEAPTWRPFQLAFVLLNLRAVVEPTHPDREGSRSALLSDGRRQDRGIPRLGCVHSGLASPAERRPRRRRSCGAHALHPARSSCCAATKSTASASGHSRSGSGSVARRRPTAWVGRATATTVPRAPR